jgi:hypothetical protein
VAARPRIPFVAAAIEVFAFGSTLNELSIFRAEHDWALPRATVNKAFGQLLYDVDCLAGARARRRACDQLAETRSLSPALSLSGVEPFVADQLTMSSGVFSFPSGPNDQISGMSDLPFFGGYA